MNYLQHTTILNKDGIEYKKVRLQQYNEVSHKATNKYYIDGKQVRNHDRYICENEIDSSSLSNLIESCKEWVVG